VGGNSASSVLIHASSRAGRLAAGLAEGAAPIRPEMSCTVVVAAITMAMTAAAAAAGTANFVVLSHRRLCRGRVDGGLPVCSLRGLDTLPCVRASGEVRCAAAKRRAHLLLHRARLAVL
jgi:hypothetical protein